ncbi:hypothetical protein DPEC_G00232270 [Dallia pectoralis]|uniref:Uncharacterized protein n=1 Tax=Dallia pectoralis TaxID=75939 RepID=A0ACC2FXM6_DALPE|nr:hypothetical protein DPEC_G00232270 [Dallia pectoralis]
MVGWCHRTDAQTWTPQPHSPGPPWQSKPVQFTACFGIQPGGLLGWSYPFRKSCNEQGCRSTGLVVLWLGVRSGSDRGTRSRCAVSRSWLQCVCLPALATLLSEGLEVRQRACWSAATTRRAPEYTRLQTSLDKLSQPYIGKTASTN